MLCFIVFLPCGVLGQVWYLIVLIPDLCLLTYFVEQNRKKIHIFFTADYLCIKNCLKPQQNYVGIKIRLKHMNSFSICNNVFVCVFSGHILFHSTLCLLMLSALQTVWTHIRRVGR